MHRAFVVGAFSFLTLTSGSAVAEEISHAAWNGFYLGINGGDGWSGGESVDLSTNDDTPLNLGDSTNFSRGTIGNLDPDGWFAGLQIGHNWQFGSLILGVEADIQSSNIDDDISGRFTNPFGTFPVDGAASLDIDWFGTVRARAGANFGNLLVYATGGFAYGQVDYKLNAIEVGGGRLFQANLDGDADTGYVVGAGVEYSLSSNWSVKAEYQYIDFGNANASAPVTLIATGAPTGEIGSSDIDVDFHTVRVGINYKFGEWREAAPLK